MSKLSLKICSALITLNLACATVCFGDNTIVTLNKIDFSPWNNYAASIKNCSVGNFTLPDPFAITMLKMLAQGGQANTHLSAQDIQNINDMMAQATIHYNIAGINNNLCMVTISKSSQTSAPAMNMQCAFAQSDLPALSQYAQQIATNSLNATSPTPVGQIMQQSCKSVSSS